MASDEDWLAMEHLMSESEIIPDIDSLVESEISVTSPVTSPQCDVSKSGRVIKKSAKLIEMETAEKVEKLTKAQLGIIKESSSHKKAKMKDIKKMSQAAFPHRLTISPGRKQTTPSSVVYKPILSPGSSSSASADLIGSTSGKAKIGRPKKRPSEDTQFSGLSDVSSDRFLIGSSAGRSVDAGPIAGIDMEPTVKSADPNKKRVKVHTAYMLWCNEQRAQILAQNPNIDFATVSRRLADAWQTVPEKEKLIWRQKARKMMQKNNSSMMISTGKTKTGRVGRPSLSSLSNQPTDTRTSAATVDKDKLVLDAQSSIAYKVTGTDHIDVAAHLKLLGEALTIIGARLQEHRGQIAVQGSLSVLLDSLLCALGPIMCLTNQVPELNGCPEDIHTSTLDNIAYIMPGIG